jgi:hypothetical protein
MWEKIKGPLNIAIFVVLISFIFFEVVTILNYLIQHKV